MSNHSLATRPALPDPDLAADERRVDARAGSEPAVGVCIDGRFVLREHRGKGGMADVWLAKDRSLRAPVAVKILRVLDSETQQRFAAEAEVLANLRHPHIVQVLAAGRTGEGLPYLALEYLPGENLAERLRRRGPLPWRDVVEIGLQVAGALYALHEAGVIHRDVKPANIMLLDTASEQIAVKLIDMGVVKLSADWLRSQGENFTPVTPWRDTEVGQAVGTPGYMPLEAALVVPDPRMDVFALGVTLYELCSGKRPFDIAPPPPLNALNLEVPADLAAVVAAAIEIEADARTPGMPALMRALEAVRAAHSPTAATLLFDNRYELIELLGVGGKAEVYRAYHRLCARYVALKLLGKAARRDPEERLRFQREAEVLAAIDHPGVPRLHDASVAGEQPYIAMELAPGKPAVRYTREGERLRPIEAVKVGIALCRALAAVHARGVLHRDINMNNVMIGFEREPTVKLLDFGACELQDRYYAFNQRYPAPPEARGRLGTGGLEKLEWSAPEVRAGEGWSERSDVYSVGLLLYRLLTGRLPFKGKDRSKLVRLRENLPGATVELEAALLAALNPDPNARLGLDELTTRLTDIEDETSDSSMMLAPVLRARASPPREALTPTPSPPRLRSVARVAVPLALGLAAVVGPWFASAPAPAPAPAARSRGIGPRVIGPRGRRAPRRRAPRRRAPGVGPRVGPRVVGPRVVGERERPARRGAATCTRSAAAAPRRGPGRGDAGVATLRALGHGRGDARAEGRARRGELHGDRHHRRRRGRRGLHPRRPRRDPLQPVDDRDPDLQGHPAVTTGGALHLLLAAALAAPPAVVDPSACAADDLRCTGQAYVAAARASKSGTQRAQNLYVAHRAFLGLFDRSQDSRDLCRAHELIRQARKVPENRLGERIADSERETQSRMRSSGVECNRNKQSRTRPPVVAAVGPAAEPSPVLEALESSRALKQPRALESSRALEHPGRSNHPGRSSPPRRSSCSRCRARTRRGPCAHPRAPRREWPLARRSSTVHSLPPRDPY
jgi:serine/threonine protein kinase